MFLAGTAIRFTDAEGAADFLRQGSCRFAFIEARQERAFALRAEAIGLHYDRGPRIDGYNIIGRQAAHHRGLRLGERAVSADVPDVVAHKSGQALLENIADESRALGARDRRAAAGWKMLQPHVPAIAAAIATLVDRRDLDVRL